MADKKKSVKIKLDNKIKNYDFLDIKLIKWSTFTFTLFLLGVWSWFAELVFSVEWYVWLVLGITFAIRPIIRYFKK